MDLIENQTGAGPIGASRTVAQPFQLQKTLRNARPPRRFAVGDRIVDLDARRISGGSHDSHLTPTECKLLAQLAANRNRTVSPGRLVAALWGRGSTKGAHSLRVFVKNLRRKMETEPGRPQYLLTDPAFGYRLQI